MSSKSQLKCHLLRGASHLLSFSLAPLDFFFFRALDCSLKLSYLLVYLLPVFLTTQWVHEGGEGLSQGLWAPNSASHTQQAGVQYIPVAGWSGLVYGAKAQGCLGTCSSHTAPPSGWALCRLQFRGPRATPPPSHVQPGKVPDRPPPSSPKPLLPGKPPLPTQSEPARNPTGRSGSAGGREHGLRPGIPEAERGGVQAEWGERGRKWSGQSSRRLSGERRVKGGGGASFQAWQAPSNRAHRPGWLGEAGSGRRWGWGPARSVERREWRGGVHKAGPHGERRKAEI